MVFNDFVPMQRHSQRHPATVLNYDAQHVPQVITEQEDYKIRLIRKIGSLFIFAKVVGDPAEKGSTRWRQ